MVSTLQEDICQFLDNSPFISDASLKTFNADRKSSVLIERIEKMAKSRKSVNILLPIGCTNQWTNPKYQFDQIDNVI